MKLEGSFSHGIFRIVPPASPLLLGERWNDKDAAGVENHIYSKMPQRATKGRGMKRAPERQRATIFADNDFEMVTNEKGVIKGAGEAS